MVFNLALDHDKRNRAKERFEALPEDARQVFIYALITCAEFVDGMTVLVGETPTPAYVHRLLDAYLDRDGVLDFQGADVPADVQARLADAD